MKELRYTLLSDGSSDQALIPILTWALRQQGLRIPIQDQWANLSRIPKLDRRLQLSERIELSLELYPCDLLFVHRDAEKETYGTRLTEISRALESTSTVDPEVVIAVIPVRMQEAWLLFDEMAIRLAAGNPNGQEPLEFQPLVNFEGLPDPKDVLHDLLRKASGLSGRRLKKFSASKAARRVAEFIDDFTPLRQLSAFNAFESEVKAVIEAQGWHLYSPPR